MNTLNKKIFAPKLLHVTVQRCLQGTVYCIQTSNQVGPQQIVLHFLYKISNTSINIIVTVETNSPTNHTFNQRRLTLYQYHNCQCQSIDLTRLRVSKRYTISHWLEVLSNNQSPQSSRPQPGIDRRPSSYVHEVILGALSHRGSSQWRYSRLPSPY